MITKLGIFLRKLRLDTGEIMKIMAEKLEVSSAFLSAVENGKKKMPDDWYQKLITLYNLNTSSQKELKKAIEESQKSVEINVENLNSSKKKLVFSFARQLEKMDENEVKQIISFLKKGGE